jgi:hypothetical protein
MNFRPIRTVFISSSAWGAFDKELHGAVGAFFADETELADDEAAEVAPDLA